MRLLPRTSGAVGMVGAGVEGTFVGALDGMRLGSTDGVRVGLYILENAGKSQVN
jgi:hypothetical protein